MTAPGDFTKPLPTIATATSIVPLGSPRPMLTSDYEDFEVLKATDPRLFREMLNSLTKEDWEFLTPIETRCVNTASIGQVITYTVVVGKRKKEK